MFCCSFSDNVGNTLSSVSKSLGSNDGFDMLYARLGAAALISYDTAVFSSLSSSAA